MSKTKHLDTAIAILSGSAAAKRAPRKAQAEITCLLAGNSYVITVNGKTVESGEGPEEYARERTEARAAAIRGLGKTVTITVY